MHRSHLILALAACAFPALTQCAPADSRVPAQRTAALNASPSSPLQDLADEARLRLVEPNGPPPGTWPNAILQLSTRHPHAIVVDLPRARLYVLDNDGGTLAVTHYYYAAMGRNGAGKRTRGDQRTPVGVYRVTGWLPGMQLPAMYGAGALPVNYPNLWDRIAGRTGSGIWLHGVPKDTDARPPRSSEGCVTLANNDLLALKPYVHTGETPVILSDALAWVPVEQQRRDRDEWAQRIEDWRGKWAARDTDGYLAYYAADFSAEGMTRRQFAAHKQRVNKAKKFIRIGISDLDLYRYPDDAPLVLAEFTLDYKSDNFSVTERKQQYWRQDQDGGWKIVREEND